MEIFLTTVCFLLIVGLGITLILCINNLSAKIKQYNLQIIELEKKLYTELRLVQYNAKDCCKMVKKLTKMKSSFTKEIIENLLITILPFKKLKKLILVGKLIKKFL